MNNVNTVDDISFDWFWLLRSHNNIIPEVSYWIANDGGIIKQMIDNLGDNLIFKLS